MEALIALMAAATVVASSRLVNRRDPVLGVRLVKLSRAVAAPSSRSSAHRPAAILRRIGQHLPGDRHETQQLAESAGISVPVDALIAARGLLAGVLGLVGLAGGSAAPLLIPVLGFVGYRIPDAWMRSRIRARQEAMEAALPHAVELLGICTRGGLNVAMALKRVADRTPGPLGEELHRTMREVELGAPRAHALEKLLERTGVGEVEGLVRALTMSEQLGTPVATALETLASDQRRRRLRQAEEQARKAPVKMLFPLVFLILPAFILLTVVPLLLSTFRTLGF